MLMAHTASTGGFLRAQWLLLGCMLAGGGCVSAPRQQSAYAPPGYERGVIFSIDGAGGFEASSASLRETVRATGIPLRVETVSWSHGYGRSISDQIDWNYARQQGYALAGRIRELRHACPQEEIYIICHSAGSAVALGAAESVGPGDFDRLVFLAPSISADYDLRPALRNARDGIDVFFSGRDIGYLGAGILIFGTADRRWPAAAAGRVGFRPCLACPGDEMLYAKLRQHEWNACVAWTGNEGGHYGSYRSGFMAAYILPLLNRSRQPTVTMMPATAPG
jgi:pimeloyl-ACP methyl ester carboxylesterase